MEGRREEIVERENEGTDTEGDMNKYAAEWRGREREERRDESSDHQIQSCRHEIFSSIGWIRCKSPCKKEYMHCDGNARFVDQNENAHGWNLFLFAPWKRKTPREVYISSTLRSNDSVFTNRHESSYKNDTNNINTINTWSLNKSIALTLMLCSEFCFRFAFFLMCTVHTCTMYVLIVRYIYL